MAGAILLFAGVLRIGFISDFIPKSVVMGFLNGMALIMILSQVGNITGIQLTKQDFFPRLWELYTKIQGIHYLTLYIGLSCLLGMFLFRLLTLKIPDALLVTFLATAVVAWWNLGSQGIQLVGVVPSGLPWPAMPNVGLEDILSLIPSAAGIALVSYVDVITTGRAFAAKGGHRIDPDQEMVALGLANLGSGLCKG